MKKYNILIFALLFASLLRAQFASVGSRWYYGLRSSSGITSIEGVYSYTCLLDTTINSIIYSKIVYLAKDDNTDRTIFLNKDTNYIYYWRNSNKNTLFKTNCKINDTISIDCFFSNSNLIHKDTIIKINVKITKIEYKKLNVLNNDSLKVFSFSITEKNKIPYSNSSPFGYYTENLINTNNDNNRDLLVLTEQLAIPEGGDYLRCYSSNNYNFKSNFANPNKPCDFDNVGVMDLVNQNSIAIYPNPTKDKLSISLDNYFSSLKINIYSLPGQLEKQSIFNNSQDIQIDISELRQGLYFIELIDEDIKYTSKFIKE